MSKKKSSNRKSNAHAALLTELERAVATLVKGDDFESLDRTLNLVGFVSNWTAHGAEDLGRAIVAIAPSLDLADLAMAVHCAAFGRASASLDFAKPGQFELAEHEAMLTLDRAGREVLALYLARVNADDHAMMMAKSGGADAEPPSAEVH